MLVLTRKENESIMIDPDIEIVVVGVRGNRVRLGINAPKHVGIYRKELTCVPGSSGKREMIYSGS